MDIPSFLNKTNPYFPKLKSSDKAKFHDRVEKFIDRKSITGRQNFLVTQEVRVTLAAAAVQLTLGLDTWDLDYFSQILIYPSEYQNPQTRQMHKGETNMGGFMCFSWIDFLRGNKTPDDKINLGLHEFGHALRFSGMQGHEPDYFFDNYFKRWLACASREYTKMRKGYASILRKYGAVNINEFFSVVVETFFENPQEFKTNLPELYHHTSILLNQTTAIDGSIVLNCRESLMKLNISKDIKENRTLLKYVLPNSGAIYAALLFVIFGCFSLLGDGYKHPPAYILFILAGLCWLHLERKYTRAYFKGKDLIIEKGFFLTKNPHSKTLPISQLISFYANYYELDNTPKMNGCNIVFYYEGDFYEENLYFEVTPSHFDQLCDALIANYVHVHIVRQS